LNLKKFRWQKKRMEVGNDESTLRKRRRDESGVTILRRYELSFMKLQETELVEYCRDGRFSELNCSTNFHEEAI